MKKHLLALPSLLLLTGAFAQVPNGSFENWTPSGTGYNDPDSWITWNSITYPIMGTLSCDEGSPGAVGAHYAKVTTRTVTGVGTLPGLIFIGDQTAPGWPYTSRPAALNGQYMFNIPGGDGGEIAVGFTKWNTGTNSQETIGAGVLDIPPGTQATWLDFSIPIYYSLPDNPDSATIVILSSTSAGVAGSTVSVDDLSFGAFSGVQESQTSGFTMNTSVTDVLQINAGSDMSELTVVELSGRTLRTETLAGRSATVDMSTLATGMYVARVRLADGSMVAQVFVKH